MPVVLRLIPVYQTETEPVILDREYAQIPDRREATATTARGDDHPRTRGYVKQYTTPGHTNKLPIEGRQQQRQHAVRTIPDRGVTLNNTQLQIER